MTEIRLPEARDLFSRELTFPTTREAVGEKLGEVKLLSPVGTSETIDDALARSEAREFDSVDELYDVLVSFVSEEYVGRKGYDDRGTTVGYDDEVSL